MQTAQVYETTFQTLTKGRGGGKVVSVLAFYSDDTRSNPADAYSFSVQIVFEKNKNKQKRGRGWPIFLMKGKQCRLITIIIQDISMGLKQSTLSSLYSAPSSGKLKVIVVHWSIFYPPIKSRIYRSEKILLFTNMRPKIPQ